MCKWRENGPWHEWTLRMLSQGRRICGGSDLRLEASHMHVLSSGQSITPWGELGLRHDGGDGETGSGLEVGGGLRYQHPAG